MIGLIRLHTQGPGSYEITADAARFIGQRAAADGLLTLMIRHTSASLLIQENADPDVQRDLNAWLQRLVPPADDPEMSWITHRDEGPDDMPAHLKAAVLPVSLQIPVEAGRMILGRWQGIFVIEHRVAAHRREVAALFQPA
ncbi:secondary thiamine-phosphate synthase enzyme YjbQ [Paracoccus tibetensis]|uniref:Secondary thiamine-phosphate synthase enzyme n=1 Tax=Paracoccus tibetensis TaxID=336292 RepID=A0A1G5JS07_9RHOB|nr:secondary thiamine-phosphate synthase enzyme YjbQ [Paracoccus tibetensis]SCY90691.1 secondary thiamine-phosphate synthase enzyme [Paracoccus tibetensis]